MTIGRRDLFAVVIDLSQAIQATMIYPDHHQRVQAILARLHGRITSLVVELGSLHIGAIGTRFIVEDQPFVDQNSALATLLVDIREKGIEKIVFHDGLTTGELKRFIQFLATGEEDAKGRRFEAIDCGMLKTMEGVAGAGGGANVAAGLRAVLPKSHLLAGATEVLKDVFVGLSQGRRRSESISEGRDIVSAVMTGLREESALVHRLMRLRVHDDYTMTHSINVCAIVLGQAMRLGFPESSLREIGLAALLHDIGKELVAQEILGKPGRLDEEEFARIKEHPPLGTNLLRKLDVGSPLPMIVAFEHHQRKNRTGYPRTIDAAPQHPVSMMTQIADVYDALRTNRPYHKGMTTKKTLSIMAEGRGTEFDEFFFDRFVESLPPDDQEAAGEGSGL